MLHFELRSFCIEGNPFITRFKTAQAIIAAPKAPRVLKVIHL